MTTWAPRAMALNTSEPVRMPESKMIVISVNTTPRELSQSVVRFRVQDRGKLTVPDGLDDLGQYFQAPDSAVHLAARMVCDDDAFATCLKGELRVGCTLDAFDDERAPARNALPFAREPADLVPCVRLAVPDAVVDPLPLVLGKVRSILRSEDGVGLAQFVSRGSGVVEAIWGLARSLL